MTHQPIPPVLSSIGLREVEVSITERCTLQCAECGFLVPSQPKPAHVDVADEVATALAQFERCGIRVGSLAIMGGEPTLAPVALEQLAAAAKRSGVVDRIEVVTNGLTPQGLSVEALGNINRVSLSNYGYEPELLAQWQQWLGVVAPQVEFIVREHTGGWDPWVESAPVAAADAQRFWETCWYRKHCVTLERGRLFACSRIPKLSRDHEGLMLTDTTTRSEIQSYLNGKAALPSCATCTPMMGLPTVAPGRQPDNRIERLQGKALKWLQDAGSARPAGVVHATK